MILLCILGFVLIQGGYQIISGVHFARFFPEVTLFLFSLLPAIFCLRAMPSLRLVYFVTDRKIGIMIDRNNRYFSAHLREAQKLCDINGFICYDLAIATEINVREWFFGIGNLDFRAFVSREPGLFADKPAIDRGIVNSSIPEKKGAGLPTRVTFRRTLFPGANVAGGADGPGTSYVAGFYGIADVAALGRLIAEQCARIRPSALGLLINS